MKDIYCADLHDEIFEAIQRLHEIACTRQDRESDALLLGRPLNKWLDAMLDNGMELPESDFRLATSDLLDVVEWCDDVEVEEVDLDVIAENIFNNAMEQLKDKYVMDGEGMIRRVVGVA